MHTDARARHRAHAAFLLAHIASGDRVVEHVLPAIRDPDGLVRNNALRVLAAIAHDHPEIAIPLDPVLDALELPLTTDRNKAAAILDALAQRDGLEPRIAARAGPTLTANAVTKFPLRVIMPIIAPTSASSRQLNAKLHRACSSLSIWFRWRTTSRVSEFMSSLPYAR